MAGTTNLFANAKMQFTSASGNNAAATVTLTAVAGKKHVVRWVSYYYEAVPAAGDRLLTIAWTLNGVSKTYTSTVLSTGTAALPPLVFPEGFIVGDTNTAITISLAASGAASNLGYVNVFHRN